MIFLHEVQFVSVSAVDNVERLVSLVILRSILMEKVRGSSRQAGWLSVSVAREHFCERVAHLQFTVSHTAHGSLCLVERAVNFCALCGW